MSDKILIVIAHPDDEIYGCGGTIIKKAKAGDTVYLLCLADGVTSRPGHSSNAVKKRLNEFRKAADLMGVAEACNLGMEDQRLDAMPLLDIVQRIENYTNKIQPDIIFTHHRDDLNLDHRITYQATMTACRPKTASPIKEIYCFETPSSTEWAYPATFMPNIYFDISSEIEKKASLIKAYESELQAWPHPRSIEAIKVLAQKRGCEVGLNYAEAFEMIRRIVK